MLSPLEHALTQDIYRAPIIDQSSVNLHIPELDCYDQGVLVRVIDLESAFLYKGDRLILSTKALQWSLI